LGRSCDHGLTFQVGRLAYHDTIDAAGAAQDPWLCSRPGDGPLSVRWHLWVPGTCATWPDAPLTAGYSAPAPNRAWDDLRLVGLKLIFLIVTRAVSLLGLSRREW
jgi:hypothetical protein